MESKGNNVYTYLCSLRRTETNLSEPDTRDKGQTTQVQSGIPRTQFYIQMVLLEVIQVLLFVYSSFIMFVHAEYTLDSLIFLNFSTSIGCYAWLLVLEQKPCHPVVFFRGIQYPLSQIYLTLIKFIKNIYSTNKFVSSFTMEYILIVHIYNW